jgi:thiol-disulfide isomerase/thioredoxin
MRPAFLISIVVLLSAITALAQPAEQFYGKFTGIQPDTIHTYQRVLSAADRSMKYSFSPSLENAATVSVGKLLDGRDGKEVEVLLIETPLHVPYLAVDTNLDGTIGPDERFTFTAQKDNSDLLYTTVHLPIKNPLFKTFPVFVRYFRGFRHPKLAPTDKLVEQTFYNVALADVSINGKMVKFQYPFEPSERPSISTTEGIFGIDVDGDGQIRNMQFSLETSYASDNEVVLRYGDIYLSTASVDLTKNEIVVRRRNKSEYLREELEVGKEMPNFSFVDFDGKTRSLSEFHGKYLLIDFWGAWCGDCVREFPNLLNAYKKFHSRGLEILGLDWDDKPEDAIEFLKKNKAIWPQARKDSIKTLTEVTYRIQEFPSTILLAPDGKVLVLNQQSLEGDSLMSTLDSVMAK